MTDDLIVRAKAKEPAAQEELYKKHVTRLYRYIFSAINDVTATEDLVSTVFARVFTNLDSFRGDAAFSTWLYSITRNELYKYYTEKKIAADIYVPFEEEVLPAKEETEVDERSEKSDREAIQKEEDAKERVAVLFSKLPAQYSEILKLKYLMRMTFSEMALALNITKNYAKVLHNRAIKKANKLFL